MLRPKLKSILGKNTQVHCITKDHAAFMPGVKLSQSLLPQFKISAAQFLTKNKIVFASVKSNKDLVEE